MRTPQAVNNLTSYAGVRNCNDADIDSDEYYRWLKMLMSSGSSLGGARPKACVVDNDKHLWIAKFPNLNDAYDVGAWEMLCHELAVASGVEMFACDVRKFSSQHHTFLTKRFDRVADKRIHFSSAMTQLQYYDGEQSEGASYLELAEFLTMHVSDESEHSFRFNPITHFGLNRSPVSVLSDHF